MKMTREADTDGPWGEQKEEVASLAMSNEKADAKLS